MLKTNLKNTIGSFVINLKEVVSFIVLFAFYGIRNISLYRFVPFGQKIYRLADRVISLVDPQKNDRLRKSDFIELSLRNLRASRTRTLVTTGGMAVGIAFIVFLVSIGYGLQSLVISRVTRLDELKQTDILPGMTQTLVLNDETINKFKEIESVSEVHPVIAVVGRTNYNQSVSDIAVYGVTTNYLEASGIKPLKGKLFDNNKLSGRVLGSNDENQESKNVEIMIHPGSWLRLRESPSSQAIVLGYTQRSGEKITGQVVDGATYLLPDRDGETSDQWVEVEVLLWQNDTGKYIPVLDNSGNQVSQRGYLAMINMTALPLLTSPELEPEPEILGIGDSSTGSLPLVEIASESAKPSDEKQVVSVQTDTPKDAVINQSALTLLGLNEQNAIGKKVLISFVVLTDVNVGNYTKTESTPTEYTITGIIPGTKTPLVYVPFVDLRSIGVSNYSQLKLAVNDKNSLSRVRRVVESAGYGTISVADTVDQIAKLFANVRVFLIVIGMVALAIAALGMFNTLTVSLLERTREVGLMKAMGITSNEVKQLFLTESMMMGFMGGVLGLILGTVAGIIFGLVLSVGTVIRGIGLVQVSQVPLSLIFAVIFLSVSIGVLTGYYPARRSKKISALDALRYE